MPSLILYLKNRLAMQTNLADVLRLMRTVEPAETQGVISTLVF